MTDYQRSLTASNILYLLAMREIDKSGEGMRCTRIANMLNLSKPSVHSMMNVFTENIGYKRRIVRFDFRNGKRQSR